MKTLTAIEKNVTFCDQSISQRALTLPTLNTSSLQKSFSNSKFRMLSSLKEVQQVKSQRTFNKSKTNFDTQASFLTQNDQQSSYQSEYLVSKSQLSREQKENVKSNLRTLQTMQKDNEMKCVDSRQYDHVNESSGTQLYFHYKNLDKIKQQNEVQKVDQSAFTAMLDKMKTYYPRKIGIIKTKGDPKILNLKNRYLGDKYTEALSQGVQKIPEISFLNLNNNKITDLGMKNLAPSLGPNLIKIDLSGNILGTKGCIIISGIFKSNSQLTDLNLSHNFLGNQNIGIIINQINKISQLKLKILDISKNHLTNDIMPKISEMINKNRQLKELYLDWNKIQAEGANFLFKTLSDNETLKVLDLSWNNIGNGQLKPCIKLLCYFLQDNKSIVHMDLSSNNFTYSECQQIAKTLNKYNKTIYGFHFAGNYGYIDNKGYLIIPNEEKDTREYQLYQKIKGVEAININVKKERIDSLNHCWICDGWQEQTFEWTPNKSHQIDSDPIFIHLQFENYKTRYLGNLKENGKYQYQRIVPNNDFNGFFYTHNWNQVTQLDAPTKNRKTRQKCTVQIQDQTIQVNLKQINYFSFEKQYKIIASNYYPKVKLQPRTPEIKYQNQEILIKEKWQKNDSIFKDWIEESEQLFDLIFENDWNISQINKIYKDQPIHAVIKNIFKKNYKNIRNLYKYYSSLNPIGFYLNILGDTWAIQHHEFGDFVKKIEVANEKTTETDINLRWASIVHNNPKKNFRFPERALIRFQMIELIVRIAEEKYLRYLEDKDIVKSLQMLFEKHLNQELNNKFYDTQYWRETYLWNEKCDQVVSHYKIIPENIFQIRSKEFKGENNLHFIPLIEFIQILRDCGFLVDQLKETEITQAYCQSMMNQIDEINSERIFQINFSEFIEALARCAQLLHIEPIGPQQDNLGFIRGGQIPLHINLESIFNRLLILSEPQIKNQFKSIHKSIFLIKENIYDSDD